MSTPAAPSASAPGGHRGLAVRWPLSAADPTLAQRLRDYVASASYQRFSGMEGLAFKTWRMRDGEWFEGTYVFAGDAERDAFQQTFTAGAASAPISEMLGTPPSVIESFEVVAVAAGAAGFAPDPGTL